MARPPDEHFKLALRDAGGNNLDLTAILTCEIGFPERKGYAKHFYRFQSRSSIHCRGHTYFGFEMGIGSGSGANSCAGKGQQETDEHLLFDTSSPETHLARLSKTLVLPANSQTIVEVDLHPLSSVAPASFSVHVTIVHHHSPCRTPSQMSSQKATVHRAPYIQITEFFA